ncbi:Mannose or cellobiose epimerase, N-acyl-D-glucosamine 2-epimerase family [Terribacillus halophilus]|uniref:Mannose or cellobiose epimerase, N-acyl-D-glucosamine 2-epimerase family n=1 Tax=Terribacillus halophilus TaxID=361279 RepID=A0A1G6LHJ5_9BACI|nr:AGE family epimerase/isomerase [Terribacillus halophilus]SDC42056.1 Mannose or cellobiose epimerase, N-acyl-D-glucosamine 2-epimerase family [Terribacillus halophilus]
MKNTFDFHTKQGLYQHIEETLAFYYPQAIDDTYGGYHEGYHMDGTLTEETAKHIVGQSRHLYNFSVGFELTGKTAYKQAAEHGITFFQRMMRDQECGGYYTEMKDGSVTDDKKLTYGHAFIFRAAVAAVEAKIDGAEELLADIYQVLEEKFYEPSAKLYKDEATRNWSSFLEYRGQNCNMHICESAITAYETTGQQKYLDQAVSIADQVTNKLASQSEGLIWENYDKNWIKDEQFNHGQTRDEFRAYGFIGGHQFEWSKLLTWLYIHQQDSRLLARAEELYQIGWDHYHDPRNGGIFFAMNPDKLLIDEGKSYWVMAETLAASALLHGQTGNDVYREHYEELFQYVQKSFIDSVHGAWYQWLTANNGVEDEVKSPSPKSDYHPISASYLIASYRGEDL